MTNPYIEGFLKIEEASKNSENIFKEAKKLTAAQKRELDKNNNNKIDSEDFEMLRNEGFGDFISGLFGGGKTSGGSTNRRNRRGQVATNSTASSGGPGFDPDYQPNQPRTPEIESPSNNVMKTPEPRQSQTLNPGRSRSISRAVRAGSPDPNVGARDPDPAMARVATDSKVRSGGPADDINYQTKPPSASDDTKTPRPLETSPPRPTTTPEKIADVGTKNTNLRVGSRGDDVKSAQQFLGISDDGIYGKQTRQAVMDFQKAHGLQVDGIIGDQTMSAIRRQQTMRGRSASGGAPTNESVDFSDQELELIRSVLDEAMPVAPTDSGDSPNPTPRKKAEGSRSKGSLAD